MSDEPYYVLMVHQSMVHDMRVLAARERWKFQHWLTRYRRRHPGYEPPLGAMGVCRGVVLIDDAAG